MNCIVKDIRLAGQGEKKIQWAWKNMPVLSEIAREFERTKPLAGLRIAVSVHVEAKTACLARTLQLGGATVSLTGCNPLSTQDDVAAALAERGMRVYCVHGADNNTYTKHLRKVLENNPHVVVDDGGDLAQLLHSTDGDKLEHVFGGCEETTTGVTRLRILEREKRLRYPVIAVNDAKCKHLFDNRFGTGQSVLSAIMSTTNMLVAGKTVVVNGFGMCGKGVALRAAGLGARVVVTEIDPIKACEALMNGYDVMTMHEAAPVGDIFVTVTGCNDVITEQHFSLMKSGVVLCNAGHFDVEISMKQLNDLAVSKANTRQNIETYTLEDGRLIHVLAEGRLVNLAAGDGHPIEIMDMSFALQARAVQHIIENKGRLQNKVYDLPSAVDESVAETLLSIKGKGLDRLTEAQKYYVEHWDLSPMK